MTHVLQPLDQIFAPFKKQIERRSHHWHGKVKNAGGKLDQYSFMKSVAYDALEHVFSKKENIKAAFRKTGLFPWNKIKPDLRKLTAGNIYKKTFVHDKVFPFAPGSNGPHDTVPSAVVAADDPLPATPDAATLLQAVPEAAVSAEVLLASEPGSDVLHDTAVIADYAVSDVVSLPGPSSSAPTPASSLPSSAYLDREASTSSTATLPTATTTVEWLLADQRQMSFDKKQKSLKKFEAMLLLDDDKTEKFEELYAKAMFDVPHAEYQSWLMLKQQAVGTEQEAFDRVLASRIPKEVPKKKTNRTNDMPKGGARYEPQHDEFYAYWARCEERKSMGKRKISPTSSSTSANDPPPPLTPAKRKRKTGPKPKS